MCGSRDPQPQPVTPPLMSLTFPTASSPAGACGAGKGQSEVVTRAVLSAEPLAVVY